MKTTLALIILLSTFFLSCKNKPESDSGSCCSKKSSADKPAELPGESIYNLTSQWTTQSEESYTLDHFKNKIVIAAMIFSHCESACPRIVADMQRIETALTESERRQVSFLLISMDPERDTPSRLSEFSLEHKLNSNWTLICSDQDATTEIANVLGVRVKKLEGGGFDHSNIIHIIDKQGIIIYQQNGFSVNQDETIKMIRGMIE